MLALARHGCFSLAPFISPIVHFVPSTLICLLCLTISGTILSHSCTYAVFSTWIILLQDIYVAYFLTSLKSLLNYQCLSEDFLDHPIYNGNILQDNSHYSFPALFSNIPQLYSSSYIFYLFVCLYYLGVSLPCVDVLFTIYPQCLKMCLAQNRCSINISESR
jgi:hypothetical protein